MTRFTRIGNERFPLPEADKPKEKGTVKPPAKRSRKKVDKLEKTPSIESTDEAPSLGATDTSFPADAE